MLTLEDFNLKDDPFCTTPPKDLVWADREEFAKQLQDAIKRSLLSSPSRIIAAIWGDWGAGKTHAMTYFSKPAVLKDITDSIEVGGEPIKSALSIPITFPLDTVSDTIYLELVEKIGTERIVKALDKLEPEGGSVRPANIVTEKASKIMDPRLAEAFVALKGKKPFMFQQYLSMTASTSDLRKFGIPRGIVTSSDKTRVVSGILNLLTNTTYSRIFLWFDDLERIGDLPGKDVFGFQYLIRDLLDNVPSNLVIIFNMTLLSTEQVEDRMLFLGDAIRYRISDTITVKPFIKEDFVKYVRQLLNFNRLDPAQNADSTFPFEEQALDVIFGELVKRGIPLQPRNVNEALSATLFEATVDSIKQDPLITKQYVEQHLQSIFSRVSPPRNKSTP